jgi:hypothetical protein
MTTKQIDDMSIEEKKSRKRALRHLEALYLGGVIVWAGLVFGADSLGYLPQIGGGDAWSWVFAGAGLYALLGDIYRLSTPDYPNPTAWDYIWAGVLLIIGLGGFFNLEIAFPLILVLVGVVFLVNALVRHRQ